LQINEISSQEDSQSLITANVCAYGHLAEFRALACPGTLTVFKKLSIAYRKTRHWPFAVLEAGII